MANTKLTRSMSSAQPGERMKMSQRIGGLVKTVSFVGKPKYGETDAQAPLGERKETLTVNFPGFKDMDATQEDEGSVDLIVEAPDLTLARGKSEPNDIICQPHDGFRKELASMFDVLNSWKDKEFEVGKEDLGRFFAWWQVFKTMLFDFFTIEERVVYAWIESKAGLPKGMHVRERMVVKLDIIVWGQEIDKTRKKIDSAKRPKDAMGGFLEAVESFSEKVLGYFGEKEKILPSKLVEAVPKPRWARMEKKLVEEFLKTGQGELLVVLCSGQAADPDAWKKGALTFRQRKTQFGRWSSKYQAHLANLSSQTQ